MLAPDEPPTWQGRPDFGQVLQNNCQGGGQTTISHKRGARPRAFMPAASSDAASSQFYGSDLRPEDVRHRPRQFHKSAYYSTRNRAGNTDFLDHLVVQDHVVSPSVAPYSHQGLMMDASQFQSYVTAQGYTDQSGPFGPNHSNSSIPRSQTAPLKISTARENTHQSERPPSNCSSTFPYLMNDASSFPAISQPSLKVHISGPSTPTYIDDHPPYVHPSTHHDPLRSHSHIHSVSAIHNEHRGQLSPGHDIFLNPPDPPIRILELEHLVIITPSKIRNAQPRVWEITSTQIPHVLQHGRRADIGGKSTSITGLNGTEIVTKLEHNQTPPSNPSPTQARATEITTDAESQSQKQKRPHEMLYVRLPADKNLQKDFKTAVEEALQRVTQNAGIGGEFPVKLHALGDIEL